MEGLVCAPRMVIFQLREKTQYLWIFLFAKQNSIGVIIMCNAGEITSQDEKLEVKRVVVLSFHRQHSKRFCNFFC